MKIIALDRTDPTWNTLGPHVVVADVPEDYDGEDLDPMKCRVLVDLLADAPRRVNPTRIRDAHALCVKALSLHKLCQYNDAFDALAEATKTIEAELAHVAAATTPPTSLGAHGAD